MSLFQSFFVRFLALSLDVERLEFFSESPYRRVVDFVRVKEVRAIRREKDPLVLNLLMR